MEDNKPQRVTFGSDQIKENIVVQIRRLTTAIQLENSIDRKVAVEQVCYFLKQLIFIITKDLTKKE